MEGLQPQSLPLLFSFARVIKGNGFVAGVAMQGHALMESERLNGRDEVWITGIAPVGITGGGPDRTMAFEDFRRAWTEVLFDFAAVAPDFESFKEKCEAFLSARQAELTKLWREAVEIIRSCGYEDPSLPKGDADQKARYEVVDLSARGSDGNQADAPPSLAA